MVTIRQRARQRQPQPQRHRQRQRRKLQNSRASEDRASTVALTVTNLTANEPKHHFKTIQRYSTTCHPKVKSIFQLLCGNLKFGVMIVLIIVITIALIDAAASDAFISSPNESRGRSLSKPLPIFSGETQTLFATLLQQYQPGNNERTTRQDQHQQLTNGNIFAQLNSFIQARQRNASDLAGNIVFKYFTANGALVYQSNLEDPRNFHATQCNPNEQFAILLHGWRESCNITWMRQLIGKLGTYRGGCIMCMDYGKYAAESYVRLVRLFEPIVQILTLQLFLLDYVGFDMNKGFLFGFSYGGQLATEAGRRIGNQRIKEIDTCDMAGPGFDHRSSQPNHREAAQNVQCIHTSRDKGTRFYNCHQDWRLGNCGLTQVASNSPPFGSHGLCPYMYVNAFEHDFYAVEKPNDCSSKRLATHWPSKFKMGYMEPRKWQVAGELFAHTGKSYPFNIITNGTENSISSRTDESIVEATPPTADTVLQRLKQKLLKYVFYDKKFF